jgi:hypothetical protein
VNNGSSSSNNNNRMVVVRQFEVMVQKLNNWFWWRFDLKRYYPYFSAFVLLDGVAFGLFVLIAWLFYSPYVYFGTRLSIDIVLLLSEKIATPFFDHPDVVSMASARIRELLDVETVGNTLIVLLVSMALWRCYVAYTIYKRGSREASERI